MKNQKLKNQNILLSCAFLVVILTLILIPAVNAETGCCFDSSSGLCSENADSISCLANSGEYFSSTSCAVSTCDKGCCDLTTTTKYATYRECELLSGAYGFDFPNNFGGGMDEESCTMLSQAQTEGACLYGDYSPFDCEYTTYEDCVSGNFHAGLICSDLSLSTSCTATSNTICYNEDAYYQDTCKNP